MLAKSFLPRHCALILVPLLLAGEVDQEASLSAARKIQEIAAGSYASGTSVEFTADEMNAYLAHHAAASVPEGIQEPLIEFRDGGAIVSALVDLEKTGSASDRVPALMALLLRGERRLALDLDYAVREGVASTKVVSLAVEQNTLSGPMLDFFFESFVPPDLRSFLTGEQTWQQRGVREVRLEPGRATVIVE